MPSAFIEPPTGGIAQTLYFNTAPNTLRKAKEVFAAGRLSKLPGAVIVSNQTEGRRKGSPVWWATHGSITVTYVLPISHELSPATIQR